MRKIVLVLGMHRSATSLTTELLSSYGLYVGEKEDLCKPNQNNQRGYFENRSAVWLNNKILYEHGMHWADLSEDIAKRMETKYTPEITVILQKMIDQAEDSQTLLLKDPRMCLVEPIWKEQIKQIGLEEHIVMVFRHPYEVAKSIEVRDHIDFSYSLKLWFYNNFSALCSMAECDTPILVLNHDNYFSAYEEQIDKIETFLNWSGSNNELNKIIDVSLRHNNVKEIQTEINARLKSMVLELYDYLIELSLMKQVVIRREKLMRLSGFLKEMMHFSYSEGNDDMPPTVFRGTLGKEKKHWCAYQLENNKKLLVSGFQQICEEQGVKELSVYGNGTLARALLPILDVSGIHIIAVYDKNPLDDGQSIHVCGIQEISLIDGMILNTAVNYGEQVKNELIAKSATCKVIDLYELLYAMLKGYKNII